MDLEGLARKLSGNDETLRSEIIRWLEFYKGKRSVNEPIADAIIKEVKKIP